MAADLPRCRPFHGVIVDIPELITHKKVLVVDGISGGERAE
jgi:hypothetical protein